MLCFNPLIRHSIFTTLIMSNKNKYIFKKTLGAGTWGTVYEATTTTSDVTVAIKKLFGKDASASGIDFTALREGIYLCIYIYIYIYI